MTWLFKAKFDSKKLAEKVVEDGEAVLERKTPLPEGPKTLPPHEEFKNLLEKEKSRANRSRPN